MNNQSKFKVSKSQKGIKDRQSKDYYTGKTITFMSKLERRFFEDVVLKGMNDGSIIKYELQKRYCLQPSFKYQGKTIKPINYVSDFDLWLADGRFFVIDTKGMPTVDAKIKAKMFKYKYPDIKLIWMSYTKATGWVEFDVLQKIRRKKKKSKEK